MHIKKYIYTIYLWSQSKFLLLVLKNSIYVLLIKNILKFHKKIKIFTFVKLCSIVPKKKISVIFILIDIQLLYYTENI